MKIAIDGPSASGKGTISSLLGKALGAAVLNTGKIYRIVAFEASKMEGAINENSVKVAENFEEYYIKNSGNNEIYSEINAVITSAISQISKVRAALLKFQHNFAGANEKAILEGRDIGSVILPGADFKFYIDANLSERARRRALQIPGADEEKILELLKARDENDRNREDSPLKIPEDAFYIDTTGLTPEEGVLRMLQIISSSPKNS